MHWAHRHDLFVAFYGSVALLVIVFLIVGWPWTW